LTCSLSLFLKDLFIYFREEEHEQEGQREREREREKESEADSMLSMEPSHDPEITT